MATFDISHAASLASLCVIDENASKTGDLNISCLEVCGDVLFVGCSNGMLLVFLSDNTLREQLLLSQYNSTSLKSPVTSLKAVSALNYLLTLSGENLFPVDMTTLEISFNPKLKNVTALALNQNPIDDNPFQVQFCIGRKRSVQIALLTESEIKITKEISVTNSPLSLAMDSIYVCAAIGLDYLMINYQTKETQKLFGRDSLQRPIVERIANAEFLVNGPGNLGVFVIGEGFSTKPPVSWKSDVLAVGLHHPYLLTLSVDGITIYSSIDQEVKQIIAIPNLKCLTHGDGKIWASTEKDIFGLVNISWQIQLEKLLSEDRVEEAFKLINHVSVPAEEKGRQKIIFRELQQRMAFIHLSRNEFQEARELFLNSQIDPLQVISIFPTLSPWVGDFPPALPESQHVTEKIQENEDFAVQVLEFLQQFLMELRSLGQKLDTIDLTLLKIYAESDSQEIPKFVTTCHADLEKGGIILQESGKYHALALLYESRKDLEKAFDLWQKVINGDVNDAMFPGIEFVGQKLSEKGDLNLLLRYSRGILQRDEKTGLAIFVDAYREREISSEVSTVCNLLKDFPETYKEFLEFLVAEKKIADRDVHTNLAVVYMDEIKSGENLEKNQAIKLRSLLRTSNYVDLQKLLEVVDIGSFPHEYAIVCGRLGDHEKALKLFLIQLKDFSAAVEYCACTADSRAWILLVALCTNQVKDDFMGDLIGLIKLKPHYFDAIATLEALPQATQVATVLPFLQYALRENLHQNRTNQIEVALSLAHLTEKRYRLAYEQRGVFVVQPSSFCCVCKKNLVSNEKSAIARFPNGIVAHVPCVSRTSVCPVTGRVFRAEKNL